MTTFVNRRSILLNALLEIVHATLHLNGYDHFNDSSSNVMENMERRILRYMGIPDPYRNLARVGELL